MNHLVRVIVATILCILLAGCYETTPPIQSASVTSWKSGKPQGTAKQLTDAQIAKLNVWLENHRWGWKPVLATYAPATLLLFIHSDGTISSANLMKNNLVMGQSRRSLSETESQELHSIIDTHNGA
jgi:hypothetical protein